MPRKTRKSIIKRFKITKNRRLMHRVPHQDHLNSKQTGDERRKKRHSKRAQGSIIDRIIEFKNR